MKERLASALLVGALLRRVQAEGGFGAVLHRGNEMSGIILVLALERGRFLGLYERMTDLSGQTSLVGCGPESADETAISDYVERRRRSDPDMWVLELDVADSPRLAAQILCPD